MGRSFRGKRNPKLEIRNPIAEDGNPKLESRNPKQTQKQKSEKKKTKKLGAVLEVFPYMGCSCAPSSMPARFVEATSGRLSAYGRRPHLRAGAAEKFSEFSAF
jgi:hypothetical protein